MFGPAMYFHGSTELVHARHVPGILAMPTSRIRSETRRFITKIIAWDLQHLLQGRFATLDPLGVPWPKNSLHATRGGQAMLQRACFAFWKGDQEAHSRAHALHRYYGKSLCCDWCLAKSNDSVLTLRLLHGCGLASYGRAHCSSARHLQSRSFAVAGCARIHETAKALRQTLGFPLEFWLYNSPIKGRGSPPLEHVDRDKWCAAVPSTDHERLLVLRVQKSIYKMRT